MKKLPTLFAQVLSFGALTLPSAALADSGQCAGQPCEIPHFAAAVDGRTGALCPDLSGGWSGTCRDRQGQTSPGDFVFVQNSCADIYVNNQALKVPSSYRRPVVIANGLRTESGSVAWLDGQVLQQVDSLLEQSTDGTTMLESTRATTFTRRGSELEVAIRTVTSKGGSGNAVQDTTVRCVVTAVPTR